MFIIIICKYDSIFFKIEIFFICSHNVKLQIKMFKPVFIVNDKVN